MAAAPSASPRIMVIRKAASDRDVPPIYGERMPGVFVEHEVDSASWAAVKLVQTQLADAAHPDRRRREDGTGRADCRPQPQTPRLHRLLWRRGGRS